MKEQTKNGILAMLKQQAASIDEQLAKLTAGRQSVAIAIEELEQVKCKD